MHWFTTTEAGNGTRAEASKKIGNEKVNMTAGAFIASNATMGEGCTGIFAEVNAHGQGFSVQRIIMHNFGTTLTGGFHATLIIPALDCLILTLGVIVFHFLPLNSRKRIWA
ncbi:uncharacterized protein LOC129252721 isoform X2 [Anastrepha obliqua]|uniref:uncharacterized protein LOC129252721 isoform X2 n=1 Tax=Anastrepha obliqua TaxID=95512 RepID=UPI002409A7D0|nr:uncharacterized protein LOC129252721 isoform X2 [Anastrepha obliqua]